jgi:hypothetical protein
MLAFQQGSDTFLTVGKDPDLQYMGNVFHEKVAGQSVVHDIVLLEVLQDGRYNIGHVSLPAVSEPIEK